MRLEFLPEAFGKSFQLSTLGNSSMIDSKPIVADNLKLFMHFLVIKFRRAGFSLFLHFSMDTCTKI